MRISGTEPSSVILSQTVEFKKLKSEDQKLPKQAEAKRDGVYKPTKLQFQTILTLLTILTILQSAHITVLGGRLLKMHK